MVSVHLVAMETALKVQDRVHEPLSAPVTGSSSEIIIPRDSLLRSELDKAINGAKATEPLATYSSSRRALHLGWRRETGPWQRIDQGRSVYLQ